MIEKVWDRLKVLELVQLISFKKRKLSPKPKITFHKKRFNIVDKGTRCNYMALVATGNKMQAL